MCEYLAVGLRAKGDTGAFKPRAQCRGVFDDAVVDDRDAVRRIAVRMGVPVTRLAMGRPTRVRDARCALEARRQQPFELAHPPLTLGEAQLAGVGDRDP